MYPISDAPNSFDLYTITDFFSEIFDMSIDRTIVDVVIISYDILHE